MTQTDNTQALVATEQEPMNDSLSKRKLTREELFNPDGTPTTDLWRRIGVELRKPMPTKGRPGRGGKTFDYINARQVQDRLDAVVSPGCWSTSFRVIDIQNCVVECTLTIFGVSKSDVGYSNAPDRDDESEPMKAAYSDAFKRAAVHHGIGRFLYGD